VARKEKKRRRETVGKVQAALQRKALRNFEEFQVRKWDGNRTIGFGMR